MAETALSGEITVNTTTTGDQFHGATVALAGGGFVVVWEDAQRGAIYGQRYDSSGSVAGGEFLVSAITSGSIPSVGPLAGGGFAVSWKSGSGTGADIYARVFDSSGTALANDFAVTSASNEQLNPRVTGLTGGGFLVTWDTFISGSYEDVRAQLYNSSGATVGSQFVLNPTTADRQSFSSIASLSGGGFVAVWQSVTPPGSFNIELIAQRYNSSGGIVGGEFQVNTTTTGNQKGDDVAVMSDGSMVFSWITPGGGGGGQVYARRFDSSGTAISSEITISSTGAGSLVATSISPLANGGFVVSWVDSNGGTDRVLARGYDSSNNPITSIFEVTQTNSGVHFLTVDGAALTGGSVVFAWDGEGNDQDILLRRFTISNSIDGTSGNDTLNGTAGNDIVNALAGNDSLFLQQGGNDTVNAGDGNDGIYFGGALTSDDAIDGGIGTDTLALQGVYGGVTLGSGVIAVEVLLVLPGNNTSFGYVSGIPTSYAVTTVDANVAAATVLTVQATELRSNENLTFNGSAETNGTFRIFAGKGNDSLAGGSGNDGFFFGADANLTGADVVAGNGGTDSIALRGNYVGGTAVAFQNGSFTGVEVVTFLSGHTNEFGGPIDTNGFDYDVTFVNANIPSSIRLDVIASNLRANESARVDASAELDGSIRVLSGAGDDILLGSANADILFGGLGADTIDGGGGADNYIYRATGESTSASRDIVTFATGDKFDLSVIDAISSTGPNDAFTFIGSSAFSSTAGQLRAFSSGAGQWTIEADVNGDSSADLVITVNTGASIVSSDFIL